MTTIPCNNKIPVIVEEGISRPPLSSYLIPVSCSKNGQLEETGRSFSTRLRIFILFCCCLASISSALTVHIYYPSLPVLEKNLKTSATAVNASVSVYKLVQAIWPPFVASISDVLGRRLIYLLAAPIGMGSCVELALAPTISVLIGLRVCQALGMSLLNVLGFGIIADISDASSRSVYISIYSTIFRVFTLVGPTIGGAILYNLSWRFNFWFLLCVNGIVFSTIILFLPETLPSSLMYNNKKNITPIQWIIHYCKQQHNVTIANNLHGEGKDKHRSAEEWRTQKQDSNKGSSNKLSFKNLTTAFRNLSKIHVLATLLLSGLHNALQDSYNITTVRLFTDHFGLDSQMVGLCYLPQSVGGVVGGLISGVYLRYWFNKTLRHYNSKENNGNNYSTSIKEEGNGPEHTFVIGDKSKVLPYNFPIYKVRLLPVWINTIFVQIITALYGWCFVWNMPLIVLLFLQFFVGINISIVDSAISTLAMDFRPNQGAFIGASCMLFSQGFGAIASFCIYPIIQAVGVGYAFTIASLLLAVTGNLLIILLLIYGSKWRESCDKKEAVSNKEKS